MARAAKSKSLSIKTKRDSVKKSNPVGRPTKYTPEILEDVRKYARAGCIVDQIAAIIDVHRDTVYEWMKVYPEFSDAVNNGKQHADGKVVMSLFARATGYEHPEDKIFLHKGKAVTVKTIKHYPPDTAAAFIWLKNRCAWRDKLDVAQEVTHKPPLDVKKLSTKELEVFRSLMEKAKPDDV